ncbi:helix-turn-helix domain-containing protein [Lacrimispora sp.]|uniref:helix-turn-helix domain-containing protein n=1 Tax=Lacrimispora sp. TaxID=2719234 RepID=UPI00289DE8F3|nr:AraC family transcriptional regulator [Lacrimispora sp.]
MNQETAFNKLKNKKLLPQLFTVLLGFSIILMVVTCLVVNHQTTNSIMQKNNLTYSNMVKVSSQTLDTLLSGYHDSLTHITYDSEIINAVVNPKTQDHAANYQVLSVLNSYCQENEAIEAIYLHIRKTDQIHTSTYTATTLDQFSEMNLIKNHIGNYHTTSLLKSGRTTSIELYDGRIYLVRDFPLNKDKSLGTLYMKLNSNTIFDSTLSASQTAYSNLLAYDNDWNPLFPILIDYQSLPDHVFNLLSETDMDHANTRQIEGYHYFLYPSEQSHVNLVLAVDDAYFSPGFGDTMRNTFPFLILILVLSIILTYCILQLSYFPILKLTKMVSTDSTEHDFVTNEWNFLMNRFFSMSQKREELDQILGSMIPQISKEFYFELLNGKPLEPEYIETMLTNLESPIKPYGTFGIIALTANDTLDVSRRNQILEHLSRLLNDYKDTLCNYILQAVDKSLYVFILQYNPYANKYQITNLEIKLEQFFYELTDIQGQAWLEVGPKCNSLQHISVSYMETLKRLTQKKYTVKNKQEYSLDDFDDSVTLNYSYFQVQLSAIVGYLMVGNDELALQKSLHLCSLICQGQTNDEIYSAFASYHQAFLNALTTYHITETNQKEYAFIFEAYPYQTDEEITPESVKKYMERFCIAAIQLLLNKYQKQQHKYLIKVKRLIEEHYIDPDLSLNLLAEECGTTTSYLSKLFKESFGINFVEYLNHHRIDQAAILLDSGTDTIGEIAIATGFNSQQNFIRVFKKQKGKTPGQYRSAK